MTVIHPSRALCLRTAQSGTRVLYAAILGLAVGAFSGCGDGGAEDEPFFDVVQDETGRQLPDAVLDDDAITDTSFDDVSEPDALDVGAADGSGDASDDTETIDAESPDTDAGGLLPGERPCAETVLTTETVRRPADIVMFIDTSGSMGQETRTVEANIARFAEFVEASRIDYRVMLIADATVCFPQPLSSENACPDRNGPRYQHTRQRVDSVNGLSVTLNVLRDATPFLREDALLHVIAVTDDDSNLAADDFLTSIRAAGVDPIVHGIIGTADESGQGCCGLTGCTARIGEEYISLAASTGGVLASICEPDWSEVFDEIALRVATRSAERCMFSIPPLPDNVELEPTRANVFYINNFGDQVVLPNLETADGCDGRVGWYYDDPLAPRQLLLCPAACDLRGGEVQIELGCDTIKT
jgi:hypothetical protein